MLLYNFYKVEYVYNWTRFNYLFIHFRARSNNGRAERGDSAAEARRKQERSSAPYAVAYSPRGSENILGNVSGWNENRPLIIRLGDFRPMPAHEQYL